jgi:hypothetical protein
MKLWVKQRSASAGPLPIAERIGSGPCAWCATGGQIRTTGQGLVEIREDETAGLSLRISTINLGSPEAWRKPSLRVHASLAGAFPRRWRGPSIEIACRLYWNRGTHTEARLP